MAEETKPQQCVFCDRAQFEERIIAENSDYYIIATLGQIVQGYTLVIPKKHIPCLAALASEQTKSMVDVIKTTIGALSSGYCLISQPPVTLFEHGIVGQTIKHAHLHILPRAIDMTDRVGADFPGVDTEELEFIEQLSEFYKNYLQPYLFWTTESKGMVCWNPSATNQYLRIVAAELLGRPERANWRTMDPKLDKRLWSDTVKRLKPHFPQSWRTS